MGSSKKHKEKDREHKRKRKHRSRDRSRSESKERRHRDREGKERERHRSRSDSKERRHRDREGKERQRHGEKRRRLDHDVNEELIPVPAHVEYGEGVAAPVRSPSPVVAKRAVSDDEDTSGGGANLSLSIQQTNELRAKLGLKPLEVTDGGGSKQDGSGIEKQDVHKPAVNLAAVKKTADLRDKMEVLREKRRVQDLLDKVKSLGADSDDEDSAAAWVLKSRKLDEERKMAEQRAKMLEEMDAEFGIGGLIEQEFGTKKKQEYSSRDLKGLKVEHDQEMFKEGKTVILTLKDKGILDEDADDTLINVNIIDDERAAKNVENKKKKPDYQPYDQDEFDEDGMLKSKEILDKYDEVIHGQKKESFELGDAGRYNTIYERNMKEMKASLAAQSERLELPPLVVANEYFTPAEMEAQNKFKKTSRKARKIRKKEKVTADDLLGLEDNTIEDLGSRKKARYDNGEVKEEVEVKIEPAIPGLDFVDQDENDLMADDILGPSEDLTGVVVDEDTAALELELSLNKARRLNQNKNLKRSNERDIIASLRADIVDSTPDLASSISINSTSEFCRSLGDIPTYGQSGNRAYDEEEEMMEYDKDQADSRHGDDDDDEQGGGTGWQSVEIDSRPVDLASLPESSVLDEEPVVKHGLAGALLLARKKGYLDQEIVRKTAALNPTVADLHAQNYSIEDKKLDEDDKYRKRDRYIGTGGMEFREKEGYKPEIKLDYVDDGGRTMTPKEAFRMLSHRFHGKGSGKKKTEKRMKKIEEDQLMRSMSSTDTPLNTVHLLQEKQKADKVPYIVLSGGKGLASNSIAK